MIERYGDAGQFLSLFTPDLQTFAAKEWERAYTGTAPSLEVVAHGYGDDTAVVWLCIQLENLNLFAGVKEKMAVSRQKELSRLILAEYAYLKVSELLLFFHRLKCGRYGRFYGAVDALFISSALLEFVDERRKELLRIEAVRKREADAMRPVSNGITYEEYLQTKKLKSKNNE